MSVPVVRAQERVEDSTSGAADRLADFVRSMVGDNQAADVIEFLIGPTLQILLVVAIAAVAKWALNRVIRRVVDRMRTPPEKARGKVSVRRATRADAMGTLLRSIANVVVLTIAVFMVLGVFGINLAPLIAGAGIIGLAIGFGAQDLVSDFLSGMFMLAEDQYGVGDVIDAGDGIIGVVEGISLRTTRVRDVTGTLWHVPNGQISRIGNMSQEWSRALLDVGVSYGTDIDRASAVILEVAETMAAEDEFRTEFLDAPEIWGVQNLGADSVDIRLVIRTTPGTQWGIARELRRRIKYALDGADIEIPFPQRTVWLRTDTTGIERPQISLVSDVEGPGTAE